MISKPKTKPSLTNCNRVKKSSWYLEDLLWWYCVDDLRLLNIFWLRCSQLVIHVKAPSIYLTTFRIPSKPVPITHLNSVHIIQYLGYFEFSVTQPIKGCFSKSIKLIIFGDYSSWTLSTWYINHFNISKFL